MPLSLIKSPTLLIMLIILLLNLTPLEQELLNLKLNSVLILLELDNLKMLMLILTIP